MLKLLIIVIAGITGFVSLYFLFLAMPAKKRRWKSYRVQMNSGRFGFLGQIVRINLDRRKEELYHQLLTGCGYNLEAVDYLIFKRIWMGVFVLLGIIGLYWLALVYRGGIYAFSLLAMSVLGVLICWVDRILLDIIRKKRSQRIIQEVYVLSNQLLYFSGSKMNLHSKLMKCIPYTRTIRKDMHLLINDWYDEAELAIRRFKFLLGTDEGYSFAETLNSLRLNESEQYYDLLRQRIQDYKEKIELNKESKKETTSYILFILAGVPILNTFRIFIYPWVEEGKKLFETLN
jgi:hypothetical protein